MRRVRIAGGVGLVFGAVPAGLATMGFACLDGACQYGESLRGPVRAAGLIGVMCLLGGWFLMAGDRAVMRTTGRWLMVAAVPFGVATATILKRVLCPPIDCAGDYFVQQLTAAVSGVFVTVVLLTAGGCIRWTGRTRRTPAQTNGSVGSPTEPR
jgi:hypothetical protein